MGSEPSLETWVLHPSVPQKLRFVGRDSGATSRARNRPAATRGRVTLYSGGLAQEPPPKPGFLGHHEPRMCGLMCPEQPEAQMLALVKRRVEMRVKTRISGSPRATNAQSRGSLAARGLNGRLGWEEGRRGESTKIN